jgi:hypothetical protein
MNNSAASRYGRRNQPGGQISEALSIFVSSPIFKNIFVPDLPKSPPYLRRPVPLEGRLAIVTDAGRDAVDVEVPITNGAEADGEVVWS